MREHVWGALSILAILVTAVVGVFSAIGVGLLVAYMWSTYGWAAGLGTLSVMLVAWVALVTLLLSLLGWLAHKEAHAHG